MDLSNMTSLQIEANELNLIAMMFIKYFCYLVIPPSVVGHLMSIYTFTRPLLRSNPCGMYFLSATIFGLLTACFLLPIRLIQTNYTFMDPTVNSVVVCKVVWYFIYSIRSLAFWLIVLASADRYLCSSTSVNIRSWSSVRVATRAIPLTILLNFLVYIHVPIFFEIGTAVTTGKPVCYSTGPPGSYRTGLNYFNLIFFGLLPPLCMFVFGILTLRHLNQRKRIHVNLQNAPNPNVRKKDRQMLQMLFMQVLVYSTTGLAFSIVLIITATSSQSANIFQVAQANLANAIVGVLSTTGPCLSFYLFTLSSALFRKELRSFF